MTIEKAPANGTDDDSPEPVRPRRRTRLRKFFQILIGAVLTAAAAFGAKELHILEIRQIITNESTIQIETERSDLDDKVDELKTKVEELEAEKERLETENQRLRDGSDTDEPPSGEVTYLEDIDPVRGEMAATTFAFGDETFPHSLTRELAYCNNPRPVEWVLPASSETLEFEIGVDPSSKRSDARVNFQVFINDSPEEQATLGVAEHRNVSLSVPPSARLRLEASLVEGADTSCGEVATAVWGSAHVTAD